MKKLIVVMVLLSVLTVTAWAGDESYTIIPTDDDGRMDYDAPRTRVEKSGSSTVIYQTEPGSSIYPDREKRGQYIDEDTGMVYQTQPGTSLPDYSRRIGTVTDNNNSGKKVMDSFNKARDALYNDE